MVVFRDDPVADVGLERGNRRRLRVSAKVLEAVPPSSPKRHRRIRESRVFRVDRKAVV